MTSVPVTTNRRFQDAWLVVPGVAINPATLELTGSERRTSMDGADVTDPYGGDIFAVNLNYDAVQEVEIKALGAEAADGSSMVGQFMNIVTKSGGNTLHGSGSLFVIGESFNTSNVTGIPANQRSDVQPDATLGGPILRDKVWFFGSSPRAARPDIQQRPGPVENRGNLWFDGHHAVQQQPAGAGQRAVRPRRPGERGHPRLRGARPVDRIDDRGRAARRCRTRTRRRSARW